MTVSFIGAASGTSTTLTLPTHQAGDLLIMICASTTAQITPPSGWLRLHVRYAADGGGRSLTVAYRIALTASETSGTWTNAVTMLCGVYRDNVNYITIGGMRFGGASSASGTTLILPGLASTGDTHGLITPNQWVIAGAMTNNNASTIETAPTGYTNRASQAGVSVTKVILHDTNAAVASTSDATRTYTTGSSNLCVTAAIQDTGVAKTSGGGYRPVNIRGGADQ
jgi:hypothetical protein